ncbi:hypothetical protein BDQ94DRAFT_18713 [Aspergillus welwitschiae]|uniref:Uncharacterized protein n=1 Tax=Aspergillus welwitschiae TaxID=1341132 RepID=A0A3F3Q5C2_9EURO|nr:hypothetical protein BDQ94DRAFT_18713 [Aspergillus welwitschiae]RDH34353.1 hypothetical protein BDQ94DRAFT_18713 [Aspergillus welwitschiae]
MQSCARSPAASSSSQQTYSHHRRAPADETHGLRHRRLRWRMKLTVDVLHSPPPQEAENHRRSKTGMSSWTFLIGTETETNPVKRQGKLVSSTYLPFSVMGNHRHPSRDQI